MKTEAEIRIAGMQALISALGLVEAERFSWRSKPIAIRKNWS
jgi:hypothetical protein